MHLASTPVKLILLVTLPLMMVAWLAWRVHGDQAMVEESRYNQWAASELKREDALLQTWFAALEQSWLSLRGNLPATPQDLRELQRRDPLISQIFIMDAKGQRLYPQATDPARLTHQEAAFLQRSAMIWQSDAFVQATRKPSEQPRTAQNRIGHLPLFRSARQASSGLASGDTRGYSEGQGFSSAFGWYVWFWSNQRRTAFWWREADGRIVGVELLPVRLMSDLIGLLPEERDGSESRSYRIRLLAQQGRTLYQWGDYEPAEGEQRRSVWPLGFPLHGWHLELYSAPPGSTSALPIWLGIIAVAIALIALALTLYREQTRHARLAQQRVSFVSQVSHELKTPLTNIRLYAELLEQQIGEPGGGGSGGSTNTMDDNKLKRYSRIISDESQRLSRMIRNVLSFSREQSNRLEVQPREGDLAGLVHGVVDSFRPAFDQQGIELQLQIDLPGSLYFDPDATEQILGNLLGNVEKYAASASDARVLIRAAMHEDAACIRVEDNGPSIPEAWRDKVFEPFARVSNRLADGVTGTGIGLSIARQLAELQGGSLRLLSTAQNSTLHGACFELCLPQADSLQQRPGIDGQPTSNKRG